MSAILLMMTMSLSSHVSGQKNYVASNATTMHFVGNIAGKLKIRMTLTQRDISQRKSGEPIGTSFRGFYVYVKHPKDIIRVSGFYNPQGVGGAEGDFDLTETVKGKETGTFEVRSWTSQGGYSGNWISSDHKRKYPFVLYYERTF